MSIIGNMQDEEDAHLKHTSYHPFNFRFCQKSHIAGSQQEPW